MAFRREDWPLTTDQLRAVIGLGETTLVELKREWPTLDHKEGQAHLARDIMALANAVGPRELALLIFGVDDERRGSTLFSVSIKPAPEAISQILSAYIHPPVSLQCRHFDLGNGLVSAVAVLHSPTRPHFCIREFPDVLSTRDVYVRRDRQVGVLTLPELEHMIREKDAALGPQRGFDLVEFGFVAFSSTSPLSITARVRNLTTEPLVDVWILLDVALSRDPTICYRTWALVNATLGPGEAREIQFQLANISFYKQMWVGSPLSRQLAPIPNQHLVGDRWFNIDATLLFRGSDGLVHKRVASIPLAG